MASRVIRSVSFAQLKGKRTACLEGVLLEHTVAKAVDGVDGCLVHPVGRRAQVVGMTLAGIRIGIGGQQRGEDGIVGLRLGCTRKAARGARQSCADPVTQLLGRIAGKGHHQDFRRQHGAALRVAWIVPQHQTQIDRGQCKSLAGARTGLNEVMALEGCGKDIEWLRISHDSSSRDSASISGW